MGMHKPNRTHDLPTNPKFVSGPLLFSKMHSSVSVERELRRSWPSAGEESKFLQFGVLVFPRLSIHFYSRYLDSASETAVSQLK